MKKKLLPKAWLKQIGINENSRYIGLYAKFGRLMASDVAGEIKDKVYIFPCLCFYFNHSEVFVQFCWLNFTCWILYTDWRREKAYMEKMIRKHNERNNV